MITTNEFHKKIFIWQMCWLMREYRKRWINAKDMRDELFYEDHKAYEERTTYAGIDRYKADADQLCEDCKKDSMYCYQCQLILEEG